MPVTADTLLVVDLQRGLVTGPHAVYDAPELVAVVGELLARARAAGALVVHLQNDGTAETHDQPATPGWELYFEVRAGEPVVRKQGDDPFVGTDLAALLRRHGVRSTVVCGVQSEMCVAASARGLMAHGIGVLLPRDAHSTYDIPPDERGGLAVPAPEVRRVAEWSLGDGLLAPARGAEVVFQR